MFTKRIIVGALLIISSLLLVMWNTVATTVEVLIVSVLGLIEFYNLAHRKGIRPSTATGVLCGVLLVISAYLFSEAHCASLLTALIILTFLVFVFRKSQHVSSFLDAGVTILGYLYIPWLFGFIIQIRKIATPMIIEGIHIERGAIYVIFLILATSFTDIGGYFVGKFMGGMKLCPHISPGKTVAGAAGGIITAVLVSAVWGYFTHIPLHHYLPAAILISITAQLGDLWESVLKRDVAVKDSGDIVAGHGGILDRFDSLFITTPIAYLYIKYLFN